MKFPWQFVNRRNNRKPSQESAGEIQARRKVDEERCLLSKWAPESIFYQR